MVHGISAQPILIRSRGIDFSFLFFFVIIIILRFSVSWLEIVCRGCRTSDAHVLGSTLHRPLPQPQVSGMLLWLLLPCGCSMSSSGI